MTELNNKVVYTALTRTTEDREAIKQAFLSWSNKFEGQALDVFAFVEHIERFLGLSTGEKKVLMMSMHAAASKDPLSLKSVPEYIVGNGDAGNVLDDTTAANTSVSTKEAHVVLSELYFANMLDGTQRAGGKQAAEFRQILTDEGLPNVTSDILRAAQDVENDRIQLPASSVESECQAFCLEVYMLVCDLLGPMSADDISYSAIATLLETSEASRYDPRKLI